MGEGVGATTARGGGDGVVVSVVIAMGSSCVYTGACMGAVVNRGVIELRGAGRTRGVGGRVALGTEAATTANSMSLCGYCLLL